LQILLAGREGEREVVVSQPNTRSNIKVAKPQIFNGVANKFSGFLITCRLYIRMRMKNMVIEEQM